MKRKVRAVIHGNPVTKKNHSQIILLKGRHILIPSKPYNKYSKIFKTECTKNKISNLLLSGRYNLECKYYMQTKRRIDLTNLLAATCDLLVANSVIVDDNSNVIVSLNGSEVFYDKENPRVEMLLTKVA